MARPRRPQAALPPLPPPGISPGERLRMLRVERGLSLSQLAKLAGVRKGTLVDIERGRTLMPHHDTLARIAAVFGMTVDVLRRQTGMHGGLFPTLRREETREGAHWSPRTERVALLMETLPVDEQTYVEAICQFLQARQRMPGIGHKGEQR